MKEEIRQKLTGAVIGLARTCENNEKTENTNRVFLEALTVAGDWSASIFDMSEMLEKVRNEKYTVSPGCVTCAAPCGNTDDYDMENLWKESEEIGAFKNTILMVICQTAAKLYHADQTEESETVKLLFRALCMISFEGWDVAGLTSDGGTWKSRTDIKINRIILAKKTLKGIRKNLFQSLFFVIHSKEVLLMKDKKNYLI